MASAALTCQDWYRVRRGEDEIAWGKTHVDPLLPDVLFSRRASQELALLRPDRQRAVRQCLQQLTQASPEAQGTAVLHGADRRVVQVDGLRIVFRFLADRRQLLISTIRGGDVLDPENVGPPSTAHPDGTERQASQA